VTAAGTNADHVQAPPLPSAPSRARSVWPGSREGVTRYMRFHNRVLHDVAAAAGRCCRVAVTVPVPTRFMSTRAVIIVNAKTPATRRCV